MENATTCPDCGADFETNDSISELPVQILDQQCSDCDTNSKIAIVNYCANDYVAIAQSLPDDGCWFCDNDPMVRCQRVGRPVKGRCMEHLPGHYQTAIEMFNEL